MAAYDSKMFDRRFVLGDAAFVAGHGERPTVGATGGDDLRVE